MSKSTGRVVPTNSRSIAKVTRRAAHLESLEQRRLFALLGIASTFPVVTTADPAVGQLTFTSSTGVFQSNTTPIGLQLTKTQRAPFSVQAPRSGLIEIRLDSAGNLLGGNPTPGGDDFTISGGIDINNDGSLDYSGVLLTGTATAFGWLDSGTTDKYDMRLTPTGGALKNAYFAGKDIGIVINSEGSTFGGSFTSNFLGNSKATVFPIDPLPSVSLPASISGFVYHDKNNNGLKDASEAGIGGATVTVTGVTTANVAVAPISLTTNPDGSYSFANLEPGTYTVTEITPPPYLDGLDAVGTVGGVAKGVGGNDVTSTIVLGSGDAGINYNFGEILPASISGFVYADNSNDGVKDSGEAGISGATVRLFDGSGNFITSALTGSDGSYSFAGLLPGTYTVQELTPNGYFDGKDAVGTVNSVVNGTLGDDLLSTVVLASSDAGINYNFGELLPASISGFVYADNSNDGVKNSGEQGIPGATVRLFDGSGNFITTASTGSDGSYSFAGLMPGTYIVQELTPNGYLDGKDAVGTVNSVVNGTLGNDLLSTVVLASSDAGINYNFGEIVPASISGHVYLDANNDGNFDSGEVGISGVNVFLIGDNGTFVGQTVSGGAYSFTNLAPGNYQISESPTPYLDGKDTVGTVDNVIVGSLYGTAPIYDNFANVSLTPGSTGVNYNFGEIIPGSISGFVYVDTNNDGIYQAGSETPIVGVPINLVGVDDLGNNVAFGTATGTDGSYLFRNLRPGTYTVTEASQPAAYLDGKDTVGTVNTVTVGTLAGIAPIYDSLTDISINSSEAGINYNFGEVLPASISGFVYVDSNNDGVYQTGTETPISAVPIALSGFDDLGNPVTASTTTGADGSYSFNNLRPGHYSVEEATQPSAYLDGKDAVGTVSNVTVGTLGNDVLSDADLRPTDAGVNYNFGEVLPASLSGFVYVDANNNGLKETGETPIAGVTIHLYDSTGTEVANAATLADGSYSFAGLYPDTYSVTEDQPGAYFDGKDTTGTVASVTVGSLAGTAPLFDAFSSVTLLSAASGVNYNFGELLPASVAGFVYVDANNNGLKETSETPISGVLITLTGTDDVGASVNTTLNTLADGSYSFTGLRPGTYVLTETQPAAYLDGKDTIGTPGGTTTNDKFSAINLAAGFNGVNNNFGELLPATASISGFVYVDTNNNGIKESGEASIPGAKVVLTGSNDLGQSINLTAYTIADGSYVFTGLRAGTYVVTETQPAGYNDGKDAVGTFAGNTRGTLGNDVLSAIAIPTGGVGINYNFGEIVPVVYGSISGTKFLDITGNGFSSDDTGLKNVTIQLYKDVNSSGTVDAADGAAIATAVTANDGSYSFGSLPAGKYLVKEVLTSNYIRTGPTLTDTYAITLTAGQNSTGNNFDNFLKDCGCGISNIYYIINGQTKVTDLRGNTNQGDTVQAFFTVAPGTTATLSLVSYTAPAASFNASTAAQQVIYDLATGTFTAGTYSLTVLNPSSYYQVDFVCGKAIDKFGPANSNIFYSAQSRLYSADNDGTSTPVVNISSISGFAYVDKNNNGVFDFGEKPISNVKMTLTGTTTSGASVTKTVNTDSAGKYVFTGLAAGTYSVTETQLAGHAEGKINAVGTNGGSATKNLFSSITIRPGDAASWYNFGECN